MTPKPETLFPWGTQPRRLYEALTTCGEISNYQITRELHILAYSGVISRIRKALRPHSLDIAKRHYPGGVWTYRIATKEREPLNA